MIKRIFKDWTSFEICFLIISILIISICFLVGSNKNILTLIVSILGITTVICGAKGLVISPFINIIYNIIYIILCFFQDFYGEVLIYIFIMTPINVFTIISWLKNRSNENKSIVKVNKIEKREYLILGIITTFITFIFYFLLKLLNTNALLISTLSITDSVIASYLMFRRSSNYALIYIINDIILIILWLTTMQKEGFTYLPIIVTFAIFLINDIYGLIMWKKREKFQNKNNYI